MKTYIITIDAPGSEGRLEYAMDEDEYKAFKLFAETWNEHHQSHAEPYIKVEEHENS